MRFARWALAALGAAAAVALIAFAFRSPPPPVAEHAVAPPTLPTPQPLPPAPQVVEPPRPAEPLPSAEPAAVAEPALPAATEPLASATAKPVPMAAPPRPMAVARAPAAQPEPEPARAEVLPTALPAPAPPPDAEQTVRNTLRLSMTAFEACYQNALRRDSRVKGRVVVTVHAEASGKVVAAKMEETTIRDEGVVACITARLKGLRFPPLGEDVEVTVPLSLVPRDL